MISKVNVYGLEESIIASGFPKSSNPDFSLNRAQILSKVPSGSGHDCFLKGIIVQCDIEASSYWWPQFQRYHFADIISSESKMHSICNFDLNNKFNDKVFKRTMCLLKSLIDLYNKDNNYPKEIILDSIYFEYKNKTDLFETILSNCPMGLKLKARITTNYLQLKTIFIQRKNHRLSEWKEFCHFIKTLPFSSELIIHEN